MSSNATGAASRSPVLVKSSCAMPGAALTALRQGFDSISQERSGEAPPIRIGALPTVSTRIMPRAMELFLREETWSRIKIVTGENAVLLEQLRIGDLDLVVGRLAGPDKMTGFSFEHLYSEQVVFAVRAGHPLLAAKQSLFSNLGKYTILMPTRGSIIRPFVESFLIANGVASPPNQIETVSDSFGRAFVRSSDAIWIISTGVVASDVEDGLLALLPIDTKRNERSRRAHHAHRRHPHHAAVDPDADDPRGGERGGKKELARLSRAGRHSFRQEPSRRRESG